MAGHSKWANIRHKKASADAKRGKQFTKLAKEIIVSAKLGGSDLNSNPRLRSAVSKARTMNMPKDNIEKAIKKGSGELGSDDFEEIVYEAYGPHGVAIIIEVMTDKKSRTLPEVKNLLTKGGGSLGETGSVGYLFDHMGVILIESKTAEGAEITEDDLLEALLEAGAEDYEADEGLFVVKTQKEQFHAVLGAITPLAEERGWNIVESALQYIPKSMIELSTEQTEKVAGLIDNLDSHDDVQNVYSNLDQSSLDESAQE